MQASLKKSLYLGLAALGFVAVAGATNATTANAAAAKEVSKTTIEHMNVAVTGKNAMYTRPGTLKGAKLVASTTTLSDLKDSTKGQKNWMAYQTVTTDRGSIYYKVVSFDKKYRGYVYAGSTSDNPKGGLEKFETFKQDEKPTMTGNYTIKTPGTTNDGMSLTYKDAMWTVMGSGRVIKDSIPYAKDVLKVTKTGVSQRDGFKWAYVEDEAHPEVNGWIRQEGLKTTTDVPASEGVTIKFVDFNTGKELGSQLVNFKEDTAATATTPATMNVSGDYTADKLNIPAGYSQIDSPWVKGSDAVVKGGSTTFYVKQNNTVTTKVTAAYNVAEGEALKQLENSVDASGNKVYLSTIKLSGIEGTDISASVLSSAVSDAKVDTIYVQDAGKDTYTKYTFNADKTISIVNKGSLTYKDGNIGLGYVKATGSYKLVNGSMVQA